MTLDKRTLLEAWTSIRIHYKLEWPCFPLLKVLGNYPDYASLLQKKKDRLYRAVLFV